VSSTDFNEFFIKVCTYLLKISEVIFMIGGQVAVLNDKQWDKIERCMSNSTHKTMLAIMRLTACRSQEVRLLRVEDVYSDPKLRKLRK
jgi:hypothetical protein